MAGPDVGVDVLALFDFGAVAFDELEEFAGVMLAETHWRFGLVLRGGGGRGEVWILEFVNFVGMEVLAGYGGRANCVRC